MKHRIFLAIDLSPELKQRITEAIYEFRWLPIRWLAPTNWHITLIPPFYLEDREIQVLTTVLGQGRLARPFAVHFSRISLAPPGVSARMIWLEGPTQPELVKLKSTLEDRLISRPHFFPIKRESRPLVLHVTLARFEPGELRELAAKTAVLGDVDFRFEVKEIAVMESHLKPTGAEYERLATITL